MLSVVMPFRDAASTIVEAATSVLAEPEVDELVAVDDGSRDDGAARLAALSDRRVRLVPTGGVGVARALAVGVDAARGDLVGRMDADDVSLPGRFAHQLRALLAAPRVGAIGGRVEAFPQEGVGAGAQAYVDWLNSLVTTEEHLRDRFVESPLCHPSVVMRRAALAAAGGYRDVDGPEDYDLWLRMVEAGFQLAKVPATVLRWRHHPGRVTVTDPRMRPPRILATKAPYLARALAARGRAVTVWGAGKTGRHAARALEQVGMRAERFVDIDPRKIGGVARGAPIVAPDALLRGTSTVLVALGARGARGEVRAKLLRRGFVELDDFFVGA